MTSETDISFNAPDQGSGQSASKVERLLIGELAQRCGLSTQSIRFYEREGLISPGRSGTFRVYDPGDVRRLENIVSLRKMGVPIVMVKEFVMAMDLAPGHEREQKLSKLFADHMEELKRRQKNLSEEIAATTEALGKFDG